MHKSDVPVWQRDAHPGANDSPLTWPQFDVLGREQIAAGVARVRALRERQTLVEPPD